MGSPSLEPVSLEWELGLEESGCHVMEWVEDRSLCVLENGGLELMEIVGISAGD